MIRAFIIMSLAAAVPCSTLAKTERTYAGVHTVAYTGDCDRCGDDSEYIRADPDNADLYMCVRCAFDAVDGMGYRRNSENNNAHVVEIDVWADPDKAPGTPWWQETQAEMRGSPLLFKRMYERYHGQQSGPAIFSMFDPVKHVARLRHMPELPLIVGLDWGLNCAASYAQWDGDPYRAVWRNLLDVYGHDVFIGDWFKWQNRILARHFFPDLGADPDPRDVRALFKANKIIAIGDRAGLGRDAKAAKVKNSFDFAAEAGWIVRHKQGEPFSRIHKINTLLAFDEYGRSRFIMNGSAYRIEGTDPPKKAASMLYKAMTGGYQFEVDRDTGKQKVLQNGLSVIKKDDYSHSPDAMGEAIDFTFSRVRVNEVSLPPAISHDSDYYPSPVTPTGQNDELMTYVFGRRNRKES